jgi:hypothetical protein
VSASSLTKGDVGILLRDVLEMLLAKNMKEERLLLGQWGLGKERLYAPSASAGGPVLRVTA